MSTIINTSSLK
jgi:hypothetical protein